MYSPLSGRFVGRIQYAPTLTDENRASNKYALAPSGRFVGRMLLRPTLTAENGASNKHVSAPSGRFVGRMQYAPTRDNEKRKMNNEKARYPANLAGIPDALIFFSHPFLVSRQEKDGFPRKKRRTNNKKAGYAQEESSYAPGIFYVPSGAIRSLVIGCWRSK